eukprot:938441-Pelagomonas_calceolata.AAC.1
MYANKLVTRRAIENKNTSHSQEEISLPTTFFFSFPPGDVCNERRHLVHPGHHHQPHKGHSCCLIAKGVNAESKSSHVPNDIMGEVKGHVSGETVRRMHNQGPVCRRSAPLMPGPELHNKTTEMNGLTIQQL